MLDSLILFYSNLFVSIDYSCFNCAKLDVLTNLVLSQWR